MTTRVRVAKANSVCAAEERSRRARPLRQRQEVQEVVLLMTATRAGSPSGGGASRSRTPGRPAPVFYRSGSLVRMQEGFEVLMHGHPLGHGRLHHGANDVGCKAALEGVAEHGASFDKLRRLIDWGSKNGGTFTVPAGRARAPAFRWRLQPTLTTYSGDPKPPAQTGGELIPAGWCHRR